MLKLAAIFAIIAAITGVLGFGGVSGAAWDIAQIFFWIFVVLAGLALVLGLTIYKKVT